MITCPVCSQQEYEGALYCSQCGIILAGSDKVFTQALNGLSNTGQYSKDNFPSGANDIPGLKASLYVVSEKKLLPLVGQNEFTLGRISKGEAIYPDVDFSPFQAYKKGVSRIHAKLEFQSDTILLTDLESANGTRINGQQIPANQPQKVVQGDTIALGKLKFQLLIT